MPHNAIDTEHCLHIRTQDYACVVFANVACSYPSHESRKVNIVKVSLCHLSLFFVMLFFGSMESHAQWTQTTGPYGAVIHAIAVNGTGVYAGTFGGGIFLSTDTGASWNSVNQGLTDRSITAFAVNEENIFAGSFGGKVYLSTNNGASWADVSGNLPALAGIFSLAISHPGGGSATSIFAATSMGVYVSRNNGSTWNQALSPGPVAYAVVVKGTNVFAGGGGYGVYTSMDDGVHWTQVNNGLTSMEVHCLLEGPDQGGSGGNIFAGTVGGGVFRSTNNGAEWTEVNNGLPANSIIYALGISGTNIYAGTFMAGGLFRSTDNGGSWSAANDGLSNTDIGSVAAAGTNIFTGTYGGMFLSTNGGTAWTEVNNGLTGNIITSMAVIPAGSANAGTVFAGAYGGGVIRSKGRTSGWDVPCKPFSPWTNALAITSTGMIAGTNGGIHLSTDYGLSWGIVNGGQTNSLAVRGADVFAGTLMSGIYFSSDNGLNWSPRSNGLLTAWVTALAVGSGEVAAGTGDGGAYISTDNGANWVFASNGLTNPFVTALAYDGTSLFAALRGDGVFLTTSQGASWTSASNGLTERVVHTLLIGTFESGSKTVIFAGTDDGVFLSTDGAAHWNHVSSGLANPHVYSLALTDNDLYAGTEDGGVWVRPLAELITATDIKNPLPRSFALRQNYPNPFNPSTVISFDLPSRSLVSLAVFDILGRQVARLVLEEMSAGSYKRTWNASGLPNGVYFCRLQAGTFTETKKLVLVK